MNILGLLVAGGVAAGLYSIFSGSKDIEDSLPIDRMFETSSQFAAFVKQLQSNRMTLTPIPGDVEYGTYDIQSGDVTGKRMSIVISVTDPSGTRTDNYIINRNPDYGTISLTPKPGWSIYQVRPRTGPGA